MNIDMNNVVHQGQVVAQYRQAKRWSQLDLAEALQIDVRTVQRMEKQSMIKSKERRKLLIGLLGIPINFLTLENEHSSLQPPSMAINQDHMAFLEEEMTTRWDIYHTGGTIRATRGLDMWISETTNFAKSAQGSAWHERAMALLSISYQLQSCVTRDMMDYQKSEASFRRAYKIAKELNHQELIGAALARQGVTLIQQDRPEDAIKYLYSGLTTISKLGLPKLRGYILQGLSEAQAKAQQIQACWTSIKQAERILERDNNHEELSRSHFTTRSIAAQKGINAVLLRDYERAIALIDKSLISYDPTFIRGRARLTAQKAEAYYGCRQIDTCTLYAEEALNLAKSVGSNKTRTRIHALYTELTQSFWRKERSIARLGALLSI